MKYYFKLKMGVKLMDINRNTLIMLARELIRAKVGDKWDSRTYQYKTPDETAKHFLAGEVVYVIIETYNKKGNNTREITHFFQLDNNGYNYSHWRSVDRDVW